METVRSRGGWVLWGRSPNHEEKKGKGEKRAQDQRRVGDRKARPCGRRGRGVGASRVFFLPAPLSGPFLKYLRNSNMLRWPDLFALFTLISGDEFIYINFSLALRWGNCGSGTKGILGNDEQLPPRHLATSPPSPTESADGV